MENSKYVIKKYGSYELYKQSTKKYETEKKKKKLRNMRVA